MTDEQEIRSEALEQAARLVCKFTDNHASAKSAARVTMAVAQPLEEYIRTGTVPKR